MRIVLSLSFLASAIFAQVHRVPATPGWYPAEPAALREVLDQAFRAARKRTGVTAPRKQLLGIVVPHAGLEYSGSVAAAAYSRLDHPRNVILLAFSHTRPLSGLAAPDLETYATPLGEVRVNRQALGELGIRLVREPLLCDHSLENQIPFVQRVAPGTAVVPIYVGELDTPALRAAGAKLAGRMKQGDIVVASSDLTHYGQAYGYTPFPNDAQLPGRLRDRAMDIFERIGALDIAGFDRFLADTHDNLCGWLPIRLLMTALEQTGEDVYETAVDYQASGERSHDYALSVGYGALAFYPVSAFSVGPAAQKKLLASARQTLDQYLGGDKRPVPVAGGDSELQQRAGVFVTIRKNGELRGCIGTFAPQKPLAEAIADRTLAAASEDSRFHPLTRGEGPVSLEISLLTPLKRLADWRQLRLGQGALLVLGSHSGTLLPQVAGEMHWNREQLLENLSLKAGLDAKAYRNAAAVLYVYSAQVFAEGK